MTNEEDIEKRKPDANNVFELEIPLMDCEICKPGKHYIGLGVGALIIRSSKQKTPEVLLMRRSKNAKVFPNVWAKPGGEIHFGETVKKALKREIQEEIGCEMKSMTFINFIEHKYKKEHWMGFNFLCGIKGEPENLEPEKCDEIRWFPLDKLPRNCSKEMVRDPIKLIRKKYMPPTGWTKGGI